MIEPQKPDDPLKREMDELAGQAASSDQAGPPTLGQIAERMGWEDIEKPAEQEEHWPRANPNAPMPGDVEQMIEQVFSGARPADMTPRMVASLALRWGKLTANWAQAANTVTVNPCGSDGANVDTGATLTIYCVLPVDTIPGHIELFEDDVVAYLAFHDVANDEPRGVLVAPPQLPPIPNVANNYSLWWDSAAETVKWVQQAAFACP